MKTGFVKAGEIVVEIYTLSGIRVFRTAFTAPGPGYREFVWDGGNESGRTAAAGVYFVVLRCDGEKQIVRKVMVIR